jgi:hypothetical protein
MTTIDECAGRLAALADGPSLLTKVDDVVHCYLVQFRGNANAIASARNELIMAVQKLPDFATKGGVLDRLSRGPTNH